MSCISGYWDQDNQKGVYSCPQCRQTFTARPALGKNTIMAEVLENIRKSKLQTARPAQFNSESVDVECDVCTGRKYKAVKSCLVCLESYCQLHFEQHEEIHPGKRHKVTDATGRLQEMICPQHDRLLEMYCRTDQCCICMLCLMNKHKTHETVLPAEERAEKQKHLTESQSKLQQRIQESQKEREELRAALESHKRSAQAAVEDTERMFNEFIHFIERSRSEVTQLIRDQEKAAVSEAEGRLKGLEQEIDDLKRRNTELQQLSGTDHHIYFLQSFQSLAVSPGSTDSSSISSLPSFGDFRMMVSQVKEKLQQAFKEGPENISGIEKLEGSNESDRPGLQQLVYETTIQPTSVGRSEKQRYTQGQPRSIVANGALHPHGSLVTSVQQ
ncbi:tripartite motif-containing protein 29 [Danio aesculapii]|uniref:tripartite motif-containing protein 29 n=1 Tax=Danio aesculapii TaxID=1142201 RepID=UPI0024C04A77|nr:tripartite motif-containing protein 29 [Danio aesculapii]